MSKEEIAILGCGALVCVGSVGSGQTFMQGRVVEAALLWALSSVAGGLLGGWIGASRGEDKTESDRVLYAVSGAVIGVALPTAAIVYVLTKADEADRAS